jgi:hypothetical protein
MNPEERPAFVPGGRRVSHQTIRLCLLLLPVWVFGAGEFARFFWLNTEPGQYELNGAVKGRDFVQFYVAGTLAREGAWHALYDIAELEQAVARIVPAAAGAIPAPAYGPQVALLFAPLSRLSYLEARWLWCATSVLIYFLAAALVIHTAAPLQNHRLAVWITVALNPALAMLLSTGQTAAFGVLAWSLAAAALTRGSPFWFGVSLGLLAFKPTLLIAAVPVLFVLGARAALAGAALSVFSQWAASAIVAGVEPWRAYAAVLVNPSRYFFLTDTLPHQKQSLFGFFQLLVGPGVVSTGIALLAVTAVLGIWWFDRRQPRTVWFVPMLAVTTVLLSPHLYVYDLVVLTPALLIAADALARHFDTSRERSVAWAGYALLYAPFSGALALHSQIQLSTIALAIFFLTLHRQSSAEIVLGHRPLDLRSDAVRRVNSLP